MLASQAFAIGDCRGKVVDVARLRYGKEGRLRLSDQTTDSSGEEANSI
jgi:hypothetical protein